MAANKNSGKSDSRTTRRTFMGTIGMAAAAAALPSAAALQRVTNDRHAIPDPPAEALEALRAYYVAEVARVAAELRPRFESGELHGWRSGDDEREEQEAIDSEWVPPLWRVEDACGERFVRGSMVRAYVVLAVSPAECETFDGACTDPRYHAATAMGWDVIRYARSRGWTAIEPGETSPDAEPSSHRYQGAGAFRGWRRTNGRRARA